MYKGRYTTSSSKRKTKNFPRFPITTFVVNVSALLIISYFVYYMFCKLCIYFKCFVYIILFIYDMLPLRDVGSVESRLAGEVTTLAGRDRFCGIRVQV